MSRARPPVFPQDIVRLYIQSLIDEHWDEARSYWVPHVIAASERLGIHFTDVHAKYDCASPVYRSLDGLRDGSIRFAIGQLRPLENGATVDVTLETPEGNLTTAYFLIEYEDGWHLTSPIQLTTRTWPIWTTKYVVVHCTDSSRINAYALDAIDRFVDSIGLKLGVSNARMAQLAVEKIDYYLADQRMVDYLTGFVTPGMTYVPFDAVITSHFPHTHELVHVLMNYALEDVPLYTLPFVQEGVASAIGGRWGKSSDIILRLGRFMLSNDFVEPDSVLSHEGFFQGVGVADIAYASSAVIVGCLLEHMEIRQFKELYRSLSGSNAQIRMWDTEAIKEHIENAAGETWDELISHCHWQDNDASVSSILPGIPPPERDPDAVWESSAFSVDMWKEDGQYLFEVSADSGRPAGAILIPCETADAGSSYRSRLYDRQCPGVPFSAICHGLVFDTQEVGIYDYRLDQLQAKFATGFYTGEALYWDEERRIIRFAVSTTALSEYSFEGKTILISR